LHSCLNHSNHAQLLRPVTVFSCLSNVSVVITGIVGSIGIIIAHGTP
jgi:hypothetical protein